MTGHAVQAKEPARGHGLTMTQGTGLATLEDGCVGGGEIYA